MLNKKIVATKLYEFSLNYTIDLNPKYVDFIYTQLNERNITDIDFCIAIKNFIENETSTFNKMPNIAQILKYANKQKITLEDESKINSSILMSWLTQQHYKSQYGEEVWSYADYNKKFEEEAIQVLIDVEFGGIRKLVARYKEQYEAGYVELFRKELIEMFRIQDLAEQKRKLQITSDLAKKIAGKIKIKSTKKIEKEEKAKLLTMLGNQ